MYTIYDTQVCLGALRAVILGIVIVTASPLCKSRGFAFAELAQW
jgi:hypothetical protein